MHPALRRGHGGERAAGRAGRLEGRRLEKNTLSRGSEATTGQAGGFLAHGSLGPCHSLLHDFLLPAFSSDTVINNRRLLEA